MVSATLVLVRRATMAVNGRASVTAGHHPVDDAAGTAAGEQPEQQPDDDGDEGGGDHQIGGGGQALDHLGHRRAAEPV